MKYYLLSAVYLCIVVTSYGSASRSYRPGRLGTDPTPSKTDITSKVEQEKLAKQKEQKELEKKQLEQERLKAEQEAMTYLKTEALLEKLAAPKGAKPFIELQPQTTVTTIGREQPEIKQSPLEAIAQKFSNFVRNYLASIGEEIAKEELSSQEVEELKKYFTPENIATALDVFNQQLKTELKNIKPNLSMAELQRYRTILERLGSDSSMLIQEIKPFTDVELNIKVKQLLNDIDLRVRETIQVELMKRDPIESMIFSLEESTKELKATTEKATINYQELLESLDRTQQIIKEFEPFIRDFYAAVNKIAQKVVDKKPLSSADKIEFKELFAKYDKLKKLYEPMQHLIDEFIKVLGLEEFKPFIKAHWNYVADLDNLPEYKIANYRAGKQFTSIAFKAMIGGFKRDRLIKELGYQLDPYKTTKENILDHWNTWLEEQKKLGMQGEQELKAIYEQNLNRDYQKYNAWLKESVERDIRDKSIIDIQEYLNEKNPSAYTSKTAQIATDILLAASKFLNIETYRMWFKNILQ